jgi:hypothetical protein
VSNGIAKAGIYVFIGKHTLVLLLAWMGLFEWAREEGKMAGLVIHLIFYFLACYNIFLAGFRDPGYLLRHQDYLNK